MLGHYAEVAWAHGLEAANCLLFGDAVVSPPEEVRQFISGESERALRPRQQVRSTRLAARPQLAVGMQEQQQQDKEQQEQDQWQNKEQQEQDQWQNKEQQEQD